MPGRRRGLVSSESGERASGSIEPGAAGDDYAPSAAPARGDAPAGGPRVGGATLFERMANLSRGGRSSSEDDDDDDNNDGGPSISIPRFLGRQNNQ